MQGEPIGVEDFSQIVEEGDSPTGVWQVQSTVYYVRDAGGKEIAIYNGNSVDQWNLHGLDQVGEIKSNGDKRFYLKDHLGTIRVVLDSTNNIIAANDYDAWGFPLENRSFTSGSVENRYDFVLSERDVESGYTHFGYRKYDTRLGRFISEEPIISGSFGWSSYVYAGNNPLILIDPTGTEWYYNYESEDYEWEDRKERWQWTGKYDDKGKKVYEKVQGLVELLYFDGSYLQWLTNDGTRLLWNAVSGVLKNGMTQPDKQNVKDFGPIPEGTYNVNPSETYSMQKDFEEKKYLEVLKWLLGAESWGYYKTPIKPIGETNTFDRGGFYIHGGSERGSIGCIDLTNLNDAFHKRFLDYNKVMLLHVDYSRLK